jgi:hypothetical protein
VVVGHRRHYGGDRHLNLEQAHYRTLISAIVRCHTVAGAVGGRRGENGMTRAHRAGHHPRPWVKSLGAVLAVAVAIAGLAFWVSDHGPAPTALDGDATRTAPLLGSSVLSAANLTRTTRQFGHLPIVRVYFPGVPGSHAWTSIAGVNKSAVIVSFNARPAAILSGRDDRALRHFFDSAPRGHAIYYSYFHEPEAHIARGEFTAAAYRAAWRHVAALADRAHNPYLHATLILMSYDLVPYAHRHWKNYLPRGHVIKVLAWDAYPVGSATNDHPRLTPPGQFMGPAIAAARSVGLPYGFAEFGLSTRFGRAAWLASVGRYLLHSGALFACYFDGNQAYPTLRLTDRASIAVWRHYVRLSALR